MSSRRRPANAAAFDFPARRTWTVTSKDVVDGEEEDGLIGRHCVHEECGREHGFRHEHR